MPFKIKFLRTNCLLGVTETADTMYGARARARSIFETTKFDKAIIVIADKNGAEMEVEVISFAQGPISRSVGA
jgi:hypothetical protein